jgi:glycosyltransferase involved in cell wall biosynthesis
VALSYLVPAHNSAAIIRATVGELGARLSDRSAEIIVIENGSADGTPELLAELARDWAFPTVELRLLTSAKGLGNALRAGIAASRGERVVFGADDLPFGFDELDAADRLDPVRVPVVIGSKAHQRSVIQRSVLRGVLSTGFLLLRFAVLGMRTRDPQGTFVLDGAWLRSVGPALAESGFLLTTEVCYLAERSGIRPVEVAVRLREAHDAHGSRIRMADVYLMGRGLFDIRARHRRSAGAPVPAPN